MFIIFFKYLSHVNVRLVVFYLCLLASFTGIKFFLHFHSLTFQLYILVACCYHWFIFAILSLLVLLPPKWIDVFVLVVDFHSISNTLPFNTSKLLHVLLLGIGHRCVSCALPFFHVFAVTKLCEGMSNL